MSKKVFRESYEPKLINIIGIITKHFLKLSHQLKICTTTINKQSSSDDSAGGFRENKAVGFRGSMFGKLKLKGIDGWAPPGVEPAA